MPNISIAEYEQKIAPTDKLNEAEIKPVLKGLFGEVGSLISVSKKHDREGDVFDAYNRALREEIGDIFWYIAAVCRRKGYNLEKLIETAHSSELSQFRLIPPRNPGAAVSKEFSFKGVDQSDTYFFELGRNVAKLLSDSLNEDTFKTEFITFVTTYLKVVQISGLSFHSIIESNQTKTLGCFIAPELDSLPIFDDGFDKDESFPEEFRIEIKQKASGKSYLRWKGVFIGDPLTDNIAGNDGYRFHDVFHLAHAAILHWSPVFRALIKHKRKSDPEKDESQDSGRAIVIEEGLAAYIFSYSKSLNYFEGQNRVSLDLLKTIGNFVRGYEVEECPLYMWEQAILQGYDVFRKVRAAEGGFIVGNLKERSIKFESKV